jgi:ParB/RepB/Spo0J family partition protein
LNAPRLDSIACDLIDPPSYISRQTIDPDALNELADSIARLGLLEPIGVTPTPDGRYRLIYGHRRLLAHRSLSRHTITALVHDHDLSPDEAQAAENFQRVQLTPVEEAKQLRRALDTGAGVHELAARYRKSTAWIQRRLTLLNYPDDLLDAIHTHGLALAVADHLAEIDHAGYRQYMTQTALREGASAHAAALWLAHYRVERDRVIANHEAIETIAAQAQDYVLLAPCDYCGDRADLSTTRVWRLCPGCTHGLIQARQNLMTAPPEGATA